jgi:hypothetical protein
MRRVSSTSSCAFRCRFSAGRDASLNRFMDNCSPLSTQVLLSRKELESYCLLKFSDSPGSAVTIARRASLTETRRL